MRLKVISPSGVFTVRDGCHEHHFPGFRAGSDLEERGLSRTALGQTGLGEAPLQERQGLAPDDGARHDVAARNLPGDDLPPIAHLLPEPLGKAAHLADGHGPVLLSVDQKDRAGQLARELDRGAAAQGLGGFHGLPLDSLLQRQGLFGRSGRRPAGGAEDRDPPGIHPGQGLEMGHGRAMLTLAPELQMQVAKQVVAKSLSVRQTEALVRRVQRETPDSKSRKKGVVDPNIRALQDDLAERLGARVSIDHGQRGKGKLVIEYSSLDELDGILGHIK